MNIHNLLSLLLICYCFSIHAQPTINTYKLPTHLNKSACGTADPTPEQVRYTLEVIDKANARNTGTTLLPIRIHIVTLDDGTGGISLEDINIGMSYLNYHYLDAGIEYFICDVNYIASTLHYDFNSSNEDALCQPHEVDDAINIFFVNSINNGAWCGYAYFPSSQDYSLRILMDNDCTTGSDNGTLVHELGHFFALHHTHRGTENGNMHSAAEHVPRSGPQSNCGTDGDLLCDTEADPLGTINNCMYTGGGNSQTDIYGNPYDPPIDNIMSYYSDACGGRFTPNQYTRIANGLTTRLNYTTYDVDGCTPATVTDPSALTSTQTDYTMTVNWTDNASNETGYLIERSIDGGTTWKAISGVVWLLILLPIQIPTYLLLRILAIA